MEILIPLAFFAMIAAIVVLPRYFQSQERQKMADAMRAAIEKGQPMPTEMIQAMSKQVPARDRTPSPGRDLRTGIIWLGVGVGVLACAILGSFNEPDMLYPVAGIAAFPIFIGGAFVVLGLINRKKGEV